MSLAFTGTTLALVASFGLIARLHARSTGLSLTAELVATVMLFGIWLWVSRWLPHRGTGWRQLVPGAVLVAVGVQIYYLFVTWYLAPKLSSATELYGLAGIIATALFGLYVIGRLVIGAATLNASMLEHRDPSAQPSHEPFEDALQ
jgi:uncharacterized BrkB/YihY/UPF0761 family membrane protein